MSAKLAVLGSGEGTGFENLGLNVRIGNMPGVEIICGASNKQGSGFEGKAKLLNIPYYQLPYDRKLEKEDFQEFLEKTNPDFIALSGFDALTIGLDPKTTINIHPALPQFGGKGMIGKKVHRTVLQAYEVGATKETAVTMHFVVEEYDAGPYFFKMAVPIYPSDRADFLQERVKTIEHIYQPFVTWLVCTKQIFWDGKDVKSLSVPLWYHWYW